MLPLVLVLGMMSQLPPGMVTLAQGSRSAITEPTEMAARTPAEWGALWKRHGGAEPAAAVDFANAMVVAVFLGTRPTGGYSVEILAVRREAGAVIIEYAERVPSADVIVTQALTSPFHIVAMPKQEGALRFRQIPATTK